MSENREPKMRETLKNIPLGNRRFQIRKFEALQGNCILTRAFRILPAIGLGGIFGMQNTGGISITDEELIDFQKSCLKYCSEILPAGKTPVLDENGNFAVKDLEDDSVAVLQLIAAVLAFNMQGFFDANWDSLMKVIPNMNQSTVKTSTNLPMPR